MRIENRLLVVWAIVGATFTALLAVADQFEPPPNPERIPEGSTYQAVIRPLDENHVPVAVETLRCDHVDTATGTVLASAMGTPKPAKTPNVVPFSYTTNVIVGPTQRPDAPAGYERHTMTCIATWAGGTRQSVVSVDFLVKHAIGYPPPSPTPT